MGPTIWLELCLARDLVLKLAEQHWRACRLPERHHQDDSEEKAVPAGEALVEQEQPASRR